MQWDQIAIEHEIKIEIKLEINLYPTLGKKSKKLTYSN